MARNKHVRIPTALAAALLAAATTTTARGAGPRAPAARSERKAMRYFVGVDLTPAPHEALSVLAGELRTLASKGLRWSPPAAYHLTLRFLDELDPAALDAVAAGLEVVAQDTRPFTVDLQGLGSFPWRGKGGPRVLWAGVAEPHPRLDTLATRIDQAAVAAGLPPADYPFNPHVTIARAKRFAVGEPLAAALARLEDAALGAWSIDSFVLYEANRPDPEGGYVAVRRFRLR